MWKIGIAVVITVYLMVALCTLWSIKLAQIVLHERRSSISTKRTIHVVYLILSIYLIPIIGLSICLIYCQRIIFFIILPIFISIFPITKYVIIPLSNKKRIKLIEKELTNNSH